MNRDQVNYVKTRVDQLFRNKSTEINSRKKEVPQGLNFLSKMALIRSGKAKIRPFSEIQHYTDFIQAYTYPHDLEIKKIEDENSEFIRKNLKRLEDEKFKIMDQIMLGDVQVALTLLQQFEKFKAV